MMGGWIAHSVAVYPSFHRAQDARQPFFSTTMDSLHFCPDGTLGEFREFITTNLNLIPALLVVAQRPRELTCR